MWKLNAYKVSLHIIISIKNVLTFIQALNWKTKTAWCTVCLQSYCHTVCVCVFISLQDMNDFSPVFSQSMYRGLVAPNAVKGTIVTTVMANDSDPAVSISSCCYSIKLFFTVCSSNCVREWCKIMMLVSSVWVFWMCLHFFLQWSRFFNPSVALSDTPVGLLAPNIFVI